MTTPIYITTHSPVPLPEAPPPPVREVAQLLRQLVGLQQEQLGIVKAQVANQDSGARWRTFLARWAEEFPNIGAACKMALPTLERVYLSLVRELTERVNAADESELEDEFVLSEFLDRFGPRLGQLGNILGQLGPLADASGSEGVKRVGNEEKG